MRYRYEGNVKGPLGCLIAFIVLIAVALIVLSAIGVTIATTVLAFIVASPFILIGIIIVVLAAVIKFIFG